MMAVGRRSTADGSSSSNGTFSNENDESSLRKRLAQILRYIATIHQSSADNAENRSASFVRRVSLLGVVGDDDDEGVKTTSRNSGLTTHPEMRKGFFQPYNEDSIIFTTDNFQKAVQLLADTTSSSSSSASASRNKMDPPFSFYAAKPAKTSSIRATFSSMSGRKRSITGRLKGSRKPSSPDNRPSWLRLTRMSAEKPPVPKTKAIRDYLRDLDGKNPLESNAKLPPKLSKSRQKEIKSYIRQYKTYEQRKELRRAIEPLYNRLFEWLQDSNNSSVSDHELVWGLGNARLQYVDEHDESSIVMVNGPLLEVLVEVELSRDGAMLVRPRQHTGVALHREVTTAVSTMATSEQQSEFHRIISELETSDLSPGQPQTYAKLLKRMALQLSPGGCYKSTTSPALANHDFAKLVITDGWCLFHRPKPSTVWARDASKLAEQVLRHDDIPMPSPAYSLTQGPDALDNMLSSPPKGIGSWSLFGGKSKKDQQQKQLPMLALPTSETQNRIAELLICQDYPAIVCEGPPGTGKSHTIANIVCAYLAEGKRVLVTSKGAPALSVLKDRLPKSVQQLCVDVSSSETKGMRQLQQTVERLADKLSCVDSHVQEEQRRLIKRSIRQLETEMGSIDMRLALRSESRRELLVSPEGREMMDIGVSLLKEAPWLLKSIARMRIRELRALHRAAQQYAIEENDPVHRVSGFPSPAPDMLLAAVATKVGETGPWLKSRCDDAIGVIPLFGKLSHYEERSAIKLQLMKSLRYNSFHPGGKSEWSLVLKALRHDKGIHGFRSKLALLVRDEGWDEDAIFMLKGSCKRVSQEFVGWLARAARFKALSTQLNLHNEAGLSMEYQRLDQRRSQIAAQLRNLAREQVETTVVSQLSKMFDSRAQSALIRFSQVAGKARFSRSSQVSKLSQRQRRHRQEYLEAFERCVRYIPCWILTSTQISDYLPSEFGLFDLVIIDEASQSDVSVLPGMLRGRQWLIVGDGKQVSPTESFVSESQIENLRTVLPDTPLDEALLPGRSFFDLCAQAFPRGRAVLTEHFRCAPEIIRFSNELFYDGRLVPLRLPTNEERIRPSLQDVRVNGAKVGKVNEAEADRIVEMIADYVKSSKSESFPRSIGVISLMGDDQAQLVRGRLLDAIGPQKYREHDVLIGTAPMFQGAERDIVFISMVCSPGAVPTQHQLMHAQRANVALSRARDRMVLVRSLDLNHIPNEQDVKLNVIDFFVAASQPAGEEEQTEDVEHRERYGSILTLKDQMQLLLEERLRDDGYGVSRMGPIWENAICVEDVGTNFRATIAFESTGQSVEEWRNLVKQQKSIERVGWRAMRLDGISYLMDNDRLHRSVTTFLKSVGVRPEEEEAEVEEIPEHAFQDEVPEEEEPQQPEVEPQAEENGQEVADEGAGGVPEQISNASQVSMESSIASSDDEADESVPDDDAELLDPRQFGDVVDLNFLRTGEVGEAARAQDEEESKFDDEAEKKHRSKRRQKKSTAIRGNRAFGNGASITDGDYTDTNSYLGDVETETETVAGSERGNRPRKRQKSSHRRLDSYSKDPMFRPTSAATGTDNDDDEEEIFYDTEADLPRVHQTKQLGS